MIKAIFDCDGVIFDSNELKVQAFRRTLEDDFPPGAVEEFISYHRSNGGVSRYVKFEKFLTEMVGAPAPDGTLALLLQRFSRECVRLYDECSLTEGALDCFAALRHQATLFVASGSDQEELVNVFRRRGLTQTFKGVFGSPTPKSQLVAQVLASSPQTASAFFVGDAVKDFEAAQDNRIPCILMATYSDAPEAVREVAEKNGCHLISSLSELPPLLESGAFADKLKTR